MRIDFRNWLSPYGLSDISDVRVVTNVMCPSLGALCLFLDPHYFFRSYSMSSLMKVILCAGGGRVGSGGGGEGGGGWGRGTNLMQKHVLYNRFYRF
jgi:hypothetical protein